jgi:hypothetical protein
MEERISTIKKVELKKDDIQSMIMFDRGMSGGDLKFLEDEFDFYKEDIDNFLSYYKNIGMVFRLKANDEKFVKDWEMFLKRVFKKKVEFDKFHNIFVAKKSDMLLLVTNKRLLKLDLKRLNERIQEINYRIENFDEKVLAEMEDLAERTKHKGVFDRLIEVFRK